MSLFSLVEDSSRRIHVQVARQLARKILVVSGSFEAEVDGVKKYYLLVVALGWFQPN